METPSSGIRYSCISRCAVVRMASATAGPGAEAWKKRARGVPADLIGGLVVHPRAAKFIAISPARLQVEVGVASGFHQEQH